MALAAADLISYVGGLELAEPSPEIKELVATQEHLARPLVAAEDTEVAAVDKGSVVSFAAGVSKQHRSDALNSTLLAQLNSDKLYDRFDPAEVISWYKNYTKVLSKIGWAMQEFQFENYQASGSTFSINSAIVGIVSSFLSPAQVGVVRAALDALSNLDTDNPWYKVWDSSSHDADGGNFQIGQCDDEGGKGPLLMGCSGFSFTTTETTTRFLWVEYHSSDTELHFAKQSATLNDDVYSQVREQIVEKLGKNAEIYIGELEV